ncbi:ATP-binding cassette domain-containing protein [uncultured Roseibium sp.]|uniref:peptidase domain-containing ABC transporter n=1 Tax=uncultured Roseibium sp. TaxID=1936171 RepID=UPI002633D7B9|nr:ATP-binding cassette domain-containing protein [uncultured Roseibium sp.]
MRRFSNGLIAAFFEAHGFNAGALENVLDDFGETADADVLKELAPAHVHVWPYDPARLRAAPLPALVIGKNGPAIIRQTSRNKVIFSRSDEAVVDKTALEHFEAQVAPTYLVVISPSDSQRDQSPSIFKLIQGFAMQNRARLGTVMFTGLLAQLGTLLLPVGALLIFDKVLVQNGVGTLDTIVLGLIFAEIFRLVLVTARDSLTDEASADLDREISSHIFDHLLGARPGELQKRINPRSLPRLFRSIDRLRSALELVGIRLVIDLLFAIILLLILFALHATLASLALAGLLIGAPLSILVARRAVSRDEERHKARVLNERILTETFDNLSTIKSMGLENRLWRAWQAQLATANATAIAGAGDNRAIVERTFETVRNGTRICILWFGAQAVLAGTLTLGQFIAFNLFVVLLLSPLRTLGRSLSAVGTIRQAAAELNQALALPLEAQERRLSKLPCKGPGHFVLQSVSYAAEPGQPPILEDIDLEILPGEHVAFMGPSGAGKTTLLKLILGLIATSEGEIRYGGTALTQLSPTAYRRCFGVVWQQPSMFLGTIYDNVAVGNAAISEQQVESALQQVCLEELVEDLPEGVASVVPAKAETLSLGERQRLNLARAIVTGPANLVFDEPTSALDPQTQARVVDRLLSLGRSTTIIATTHDPAVARKFDRVFVVSEKSVAEADPLSLVPRQLQDGRHGNPLTEVERQ